MRNVEGLRCWQCGGNLATVPQPIGRGAECPHCTVDLHCCRLCTFFDPQARRGCKEPVAEAVRERQRANFCGYFVPTVLGAAGHGAAAPDAALSALFGLDEPPAGAPADASAARGALDKLFGLDDDKP